MTPYFPGTLRLLASQIHTSLLTTFTQSVKDTSLNEQRKQNTWHKHDTSHLRLCFSHPWPSVSPWMEHTGAHGECQQKAGHSLPEGQSPSCCSACHTTPALGGPTGQVSFLNQIWYSCDKDQLHERPWGLKFMGQDRGLVISI